jgi:hypothetical protein
MIESNDNDLIKHVVDAASLITLIGSLVKVLPAIAALFTIIWTGIRIYESATVQSLIKRKKDSE